MAKIAAITCRTLQDEAASAAVLAKCLSARTEKRREILKNVQVEKAVGVEIIRVEKTCSDIAHSTERTVRPQSDSSLTTASATEREGDT